MKREEFIEVFLTAIITLSSIEKSAASRGVAVHRPPERQEFCQWETFTAECRLPGEILLVREALYGRMHLGRCVQRDFGFLDCGTEVLERVARHCSARPYCTFPVTSLHGNHGCPMDLTAYLSIRYDCVKVTECKPFVCDRSETLNIQSEEGGYLLSVPPPSLTAGQSAGSPPSGSASGIGPCGSPSCPWRLAVRPGQRIRLVVSDFSSEQSGSTGGYGEGSGGMGPCHRYASVQEPTEGSSPKQLTFCERDIGGSTNSTHYTSRGEALTVIVYSIASPPSHFLIRYSAVGCHNLERPASATMRREGDSLIVKCESDSQKWELRCVGNAWIGQIGSCSTGSSSGQHTGLSDQQSDNLSGVGEHFKSSSYGVLIVVGLGIVIGVIVGFTMLLAVLICVKRRRLRPGATTMIKDTGSGGAPCYWKSLNGMAVPDEAYLPGVPDINDPTTRLDYTLPEGSCCEGTRPSTEGFCPNDPGFDPQRQVLFPCCRLPPGDFQYATYSDSNMKRRDHVYELPGKTLDLGSKQTTVRVKTSLSDPCSNVVV